MNHKNMLQTDSIQELALFRDTNDVTNFDDELEEVDEPVFERQTVFARYPQVEKAILYGSRAKGVYKNGADLTLNVRHRIANANVRHRIANALDDLLLPYTIDLSILHDIGDVDVIEHIQLVGVPMYEKKQRPINKGGA